MSWFHRLESLSDSPLVRTELPKTVLRHVVMGHGLSVGSRVLVAGCINGNLVRFFDYLGMDACGLHASESEIETARMAAPDHEFYHWRPDEPLQLPEREFDFVLVKNDSTSLETATPIASFAATADLLARLVPGGHLCFVSSVGSSRLGKSVDQPAVRYERQLSSFPGTFKTTRLGNGLNRLFRRSWIFGSENATEYSVASLKTPPKPYSLGEWHRFADAAASLHLPMEPQRATESEADTASERSAA